MSEFTFHKNKFMKFKIILIFILIFSIVKLNAQDNSKFIINGFLEYLNTTWAPASGTKWTDLSDVYNRLDFHWYPVDNLKFSSGMRNNFNFGPMMADYYPFYADMLTLDDGIVDLTFEIAKDTSYLFYTNIDRLNVQWTLGKFELTVGRQRINWGINMVWNPNDIFNTYNYFDFDYVERPGSDAVLMEYYTGDFSSLQLAAKWDKDKNLTAALMYKLNVWNYDFQFFGGVMEKDVVAGFGWAGQIKNAGFTGEASYFRSKNNFSDTTGQLVASASINYTFNNGLFLNGSFIFNSKGTTGPASMGSFFLFGNLSPKTLTLSRFDLFGQISYPLTPLVKVDLSAIINPNDKSLFWGPTVDFSLSNNLSFNIIGQIFTGNSKTEFGNFGEMLYIRLKWSF